MSSSVFEPLDSSPVRAPGCRNHWIGLNYLFSLPADEQDKRKRTYQIFGEKFVAAQIETSHDLELEEARRLQLAMIPREPIHAPAFEIACRFHPAERVGGDFADYFVLPGHRLNLYLGDVAGKGLPAALYAALAAGMLRGFNKSGETPRSILERFNQRLLLYAFPGRFCASQYAMLDPDGRILTFGNAGLPLPLHIAREGCRFLGEGGIPSGMFQEADYEQHSVRLEPGDTVMFYTDGVIESTGPECERFGAERLLHVCAQCQDLSAPDLLRAIFDAAGRFGREVPQHDDMTAIALKVS